MDGEGFCSLGLAAVPQFSVAGPEPQLHIQQLYRKTFPPPHDLPPSHCQTFLPAPRNLFCPHLAKPLGPGRLCVSRQCKTLWTFFQIPPGLIQSGEEEIQGPLGQPPQTHSRPALAWPREQYSEHRGSILCLCHVVIGLLIPVSFQNQHFFPVTAPDPTQSWENS